MNIIWNERNLLTTPLENMIVDCIWRCERLESSDQRRFSMRRKIQIFAIWKITTPLPSEKRRFLSLPFVSHSRQHNWLIWGRSTWIHFALFLIIISKPPYIESWYKKNPSCIEIRILGEKSLYKKRRDRNFRDDYYE